MIKLVNILVEGLENVELIKAIHDVRAKVLYSIDLLITDIEKKVPWWKGNKTLKGAWEQIDIIHQKYEELVKRYPVRDLFALDEDELLEIVNQYKKLEREVDGFRILFNHKK